MLTLALALTLCSEPAARLLSEETTTLTEADVIALDRELRILDGNIQLLKPHFPSGLVIGMVVGFSFSVLLLPGIPLFIAGVTGTSFASASLLTLGAALISFGGISLFAALICLVVANNIENGMADERAGMVERRDALKRKLEPYRPPPGQPAPPPPPTFVPGVQLDVPSPALVTLARF